jgi:hypothetical protein
VASFFHYWRISQGRYCSHDCDSYLRRSPMVTVAYARSSCHRNVHPLRDIFSIVVLISLLGSYLLCGATHAIEAVPAERSAQPEIVVRHLNNRVNSTPLVNPLHTLYAVYAYTGLTSSVGSSARAQTCHASRTEDRVAVNILSNHRRQDCLHEVVASTASCNCKAGDKNVRGAQGSYTANSASPMSASSCGTAYRSTGSKVVFDQVLL